MDLGQPADRAHRITATAREPEPPRVEELATLLAHVRAADAAFHLLLVLAATTGARRAQLLALRWRDVNLEHGKVAFCGGWVEGEHGPVPLTPRASADTPSTSTTRPRRCSANISSDAALPLAGGCSIGAHSCSPLTPTDTLHGNRTGSPRPSCATRDSSGLRAFRLHDLRHFIATQMVDLGIPITVVARRLDHRRVSTTLDFYSHVITGRDRFAADSLANLLHTYQSERDDTTRPTSVPAAGETATRGDRHNR